MAVLQRNRLVTSSLGARDVEIALRIAPVAQPFAPDQSATEYRDIVQPVAPDEAVAPVVVAVVLVRLPGALGLGGVVAATRESFRGNGCREYRRAEIEVQGDAALQANRVAGIRTGGEVDDATSTGRDPIDGFVDGGGVDGFAVAARAGLAHIQPRIGYASRRVRGPCPSRVEERGNG